MELSIIIPVYNVEQTLRRSVDSVLQQSFSDFEIILVDDGSTDRSSRICDALAGEDKRIRTIHQANSGLSAARNTGLQQATGKYVTFVDSDDFVARETYRPLMQTLAEHPEYDFIEFPLLKHHKNGHKQHLQSFDPAVYHDMYTYWFATKAYLHAYAWNKIYKRTLFRQIEYPMNTAFEDVYVLTALLYVCHTVATTDRGLYHYCYNPKGITATATAKELNDLLKGCIATLQDTSITTHPDFVRFYSHILNIQLDVFELTGATPILPVFTFEHSEHLPIRIKLLPIIGLKRLCQLNKFIHKLYRRNP